MSNLQLKASCHNLQQTHITICDYPRRPSYHPPLRFPQIPPALTLPPSHSPHPNRHLIPSVFMCLSARDQQRFASSATPGSASESLPKTSPVLQCSDPQEIEVCRRGNDRSRQRGSIGRPDLNRSRDKSR
ncbi:hypothetical protein ACFXTO_027115 [Malus domestica]